ncbi:hypothetical protein [Anabaena azotica]|uniref:Uncharacterized protein n=1 Tax=Anabaena azotica FACHB-119 TaxID=947527 RepID=A0ABR8D4N5_9NOST|nr:hypothetical protein [Anabaena azotica]MBD2502128.1 hypothetical protein [Anabaena azotica FACHB-119]
MTNIQLDVLKDSGGVKRSYQPTKKIHAEKVMLNDERNQAGNLNLRMNAWPCTDQGHDCHKALIDASLNRTITLEVNGDIGGYAKNHNFDFNTTGRIVYNNGNVTITKNP